MIYYHVNKEYLRWDQFHVVRLLNRLAWLNSGVSSSLHEAAADVEAIEKRQGIKLGCPEEAAFRRGLLNRELLKKRSRGNPTASTGVIWKLFQQSPTAIGQQRAESTAISSCRLGYVRD